MIILTNVGGRYPWRGQYMNRVAAGRTAIEVLHLLTGKIRNA